MNVQPNTLALKSHYNNQQWSSWTTKEGKNVFIAIHIPRRRRNERYRNIWRI